MNELQVNEEAFALINLAKKQNWDYIVYGLGNIWESIGEELLGCACIKINYFCDKNENVLKNFRYENTITVDNIKTRVDDIILLVFVGNKLLQDVQHTFENNRNIHIIFFADLFDNDEIIKHFFGLDYLPRKNNEIEYKRKNIVKREKSVKTAVYTCILGDYDAISFPNYLDSNCDYYLITDNDNLKSDFYKVISVDKIVPVNVTSLRDKNRYCKMHGAHIFKDYDYSIYIDGNVQIISSVNQLIEKINEYGIGFHVHPHSKDPYMEALRCIVYKKEEREKIYSTIKWLASIGVERHCGAVECGVIVCENANEVAKDFLHNWYEYYMNGEAKRDQLYIAPAAMKTGIRVEDIAIYKNDLRFGIVTRIVSEHSENQKKVCSIL